MALGNNTSGHLFDTTFTADGVLYSDANGVITSTAAGTAGQVMTSNGAGVAPTYQAGGGGGITEFFSANLSAQLNNVTGDGTLYGPIVFDTVQAGSSVNYNTATGVYTVPSNGWYSFQQTITFVGGDVFTQQYLALWGGSAYSIRAFQLQPVAFASNGIITSANIFAFFNAGDTVNVQVNVGGTNKNVTLYGQTPTGFATTCVFSGFKVA